MDDQTTWGVVNEQCAGLGRDDGGWFGAVEDDVQDVVDEGGTLWVSGLSEVLSC